MSKISTETSSVGHLKLSKAHRNRLDKVCMVGRFRFEVSEGETAYTNYKKWRRHNTIGYTPWWYKELSLGLWEKKRGIVSSVAESREKWAHTLGTEAMMWWGKLRGEKKLIGRIEKLSPNISLEIKLRE